MSRVLVTGAGGFIGRHTLAPLLAAGFEVHALTSSDPPADAPAQVRWHRADLLAPGAAAALVGEVEPTHLLHMAWYTKPGAYWSALDNFDWLYASLQLLRAFGERGGRRAVIAGTCWEYAWEARTHCLEEAPRPAGEGADAQATSGAAPTSAPTGMRPATLYGAAKHALHVVAERWASQTGVELAWGRIFYTYGPHEHPARLVSAVARALVRGEEVPCTHGTQVRDYLYVAELGSAFAALLGSAVAGAVNMASGEPVRLADVVAAIATAAGHPELVRLGALAQRAGEPERLTADVRRLREEVGWSPSIGLAEGAASTVAWWRGALAAEEPATPALALAPEAAR
jgi:nucleoside-diphosphate-sugar epimerase